MNNSKIAFEYVRGSANISSVAEDCDIPQSEVVKAILSFLKGHPESSWHTKILRKLQVEITKSFLSSNTTANEFAEEYGMTEGKFITFMSKIIDDTSLVASDSLANKLYMKLLTDRFSIGDKTPKRIITIIGKAYVKDNWVTLDSIANVYGLSHCSVSHILSRGVKEEIFDDHLANMVVNKLQTKKWKFAKL